MSGVVQKQVFFNRILQGVENRLISISNSNMTFNCRGNPLRLPFLAVALLMLDFNWQMVLVSNLVNVVIFMLFVVTFFAYEYLSLLFVRASDAKINCYCIFSVGFTIFAVIMFRLILLYDRWIFSLCLWRFYCHINCHINRWQFRFWHRNPPLIFINHPFFEYSSIFLLKVSAISTCPFSSILSARFLNLPTKSISDSLYTVMALSSHISIPSFR